MKLQHTLAAIKGFDGYNSQPARRPSARRRGMSSSLVLHHFGVDDLALIELQALIGRLADELGLEILLDQHAGEIALVDENLLRSVRPQLVAAFCEERPIITLQREPRTCGAVRGAIDGAALRAQLQALLRAGRPAPAPMRRFVDRPQAADTTLPWTAALPDFKDSAPVVDADLEARLSAAALAHAPIDPARARFLDALYAGLADPARAPLVAGYDSGGLMVIDFAHSHVLLEPRAQDALRLAKRLPVLNDGAVPAADRQTCDLDRVLWSLGWAAGMQPLHAAVADWWYQPLVALKPQEVSRYSAVPVHLEMARALAEGPMTPSRLRRKCRADIAELRCFLQACLWLGLLGWLHNGAGLPDPTARAAARRDVRR